MVKNCCDFKALETACLKYITVQQQVLPKTVRQAEYSGQKSIYQRISEIEAQAANNGQPSKPPHMANKKENEPTL